MEGKRDDIARVWEVDWSPSRVDGGTRWAAYAWLLQAARYLGVQEATIAAANFESMTGLETAIGSSLAAALRGPDHRFVADGITVHGVSRRTSSWPVRGPVLVPWATDAVLKTVEAKRPRAIAAVASWPQDIAAWCATQAPRRIGQVRADEESDLEDDLEALDAAS